MATKPKGDEAISLPSQAFSSVFYENDHLKAELAARDARIAELERERDALRRGLRKCAITTRADSASMEMVEVCRLCGWGWSQSGPEEHRKGCLSAPLDNGSSATASLPDRD